jgi:hypothetical protein
MSSRLLAVGGRALRALVLAENAGGARAVTAGGGKPPCGVDGSGAVCELQFGLADLEEALRNARRIGAERHLTLEGLFPQAAVIAAKRRALEPARERITMRRNRITA